MIALTLDDIVHSRFDDIQSRFRTHFTFGDDISLMQSTVDSFVDILGSRDFKDIPDPENIDFSKDEFSIGLAKILKEEYGLSSLEDNTLKRALFLGRATFIKDGEDNRRKYSPIEVFSHVFYVGLMSYLMTEDPMTFIYGLHHDTLEDNLKVDSLYREIKQEYSTKTRKDISILIRDYMNIRPKTLDKATKFIFGENANKNFKACVDSLTRYPLETYDQYLLRLFSIENNNLKSRSVMIKLVDKFMNIITEFDYRDSKEHLAKRIKSFSEVQQFLDRLNSFRRQTIADYLMSSGEIQEKEYAFFLERLKTPRIKLNDDAKSEDKNFIRILNKFENADFKKIEQTTPYFQAITDTYFALIKAVRQDHSDMLSFVHDSLPSYARDVIKDVNLKKINKDKIDYYSKGGFFIRTEEGYSSQGGMSSHDGFLNRIAYATTTGELFKHYNQLSNPKGLTRFIRDLESQGIIFLIYSGQGINPKGNIVPEPGNQWITYL